MSNYLESMTKQFAYYQMLGDKAMKQVTPEQLFWMYNPESNSIAIIVKHLWGNMVSRWTDFLTADGEKSWRDREAEFDNDLASADDLWQKWEEGWQALFTALNALTEADLEQIIYIRNQGHTVMEAINRQVAHYAYHVGQIVFLARMIAGSQWQSLSIPRGQSDAFNTQKFTQPKQRGHFTDEFLAPKKEDTP
ncbi:MAG: DUF1572 family protein [Lewinellaceae bacterium]|nr:DUF1572 family protein [Lewinellaceae bacterium]